LNSREDSLTEECFEHLKKKIGKKAFPDFISGYSETFIPGGKKSFKNIQLLRDLITLGIGYNNKAYIPFRDIFFSSTDGQNKLMFSVFNEIESFFNNIPGFGPDRINLIRFLKIPSEIFPESIMNQLVYIIENWGDLIGDLKLKLLTGLDHLKEENKIRFSGSGKTMPYTFSSGQDNDPDNFSRDRDWMSSLVLLAKSTYVWLDQLSGSYNTEISRLDQIPDEELDKIASRGFSGLWLIGIWERSKASAKIKKMTGNPEAMSSAYSIYDYNIAQDLGGEEAFLSLKEKAKKRGIRLAGDMVPNHMGIDSKWVCDNPDWFVSTDSSPFGSYTFNGPDLSDDHRYSIHLEDHYYDKSDASVVFELIERSNGKRKYIYHGNDGTSMPWNDTAQLNYIREDVREHVINTILRIAKKFKIIRFDAAMILTKKHFQRLWFPEPGGGGDIPSRAGRGMSKENFNELFPKEFWKEVVEKIAADAPDTLLLAEAFWLMEPYFVRTLGMHRVYNSAFMNFLKKEENAGFRSSIKNTIEFNPEILKRFANFMNNPDEETAIRQFGSDDKYFGVCILLSTLPGLPMFGHGQIEGFREKYGMEYRKAYHNEVPDTGFVQRHEREIFPLLKQREIFSQSEYFRLYDFIKQNREVNEDVIAYSNSFNGKNSLVVYNNKYSDCSGSIRVSCPFAEVSAGGEKNIHTIEIVDALNINPDHNKFMIFRDNITSLTYIRRTTEIAEKGIYFELGAFKYHVFLDFKVIEDSGDSKYARIHGHLNGKGINDIEKLYDQEINNPVSEIIREMFQHFNNFMFNDPEEIDKEKLLYSCNKISYKI
ncbi:MAG: alpha-amylase, partial [Candidatus Aminicenantes bacterium]|nr:alpha-amylase [Candidatus Aminicenantes bacterium]